MPQFPVRAEAVDGGGGDTQAGRHCANGQQGTFLLSTTRSASPEPEAVRLPGDTAGTNGLGFPATAGMAGPARAPRFERNHTVASRWEGLDAPRTGLRSRRPLVRIQYRALGERPGITRALQRVPPSFQPSGAYDEMAMRRLEADYLDGVLRPTSPLQLKQGERVGLVVMRRPDQKRWDLERLTRTSQEDEALAGAGLDQWARALDGEDRR